MNTVSFSVTRLASQMHRREGRGGRERRREEEGEGLRDFWQSHISLVRLADSKPTVFLCLWSHHSSNNHESSDIRITNTPYKIIWSRKLAIHSPIYLAGLSVKIHIHCTRRGGRGGGSCLARLTCLTPGARCAGWCNVCSAFKTKIIQKKTKKILQVTSSNVTNWSLDN